MLFQLNASNVYSKTSLCAFFPSYSADTIPPFNRCCLSCEFNCGYVDVSFSHNMQYFLLYCKGEHPQSCLSEPRLSLSWACDRIRNTYTTLADKPAAAHLWLATDVNISSVGSVQLPARSIRRMKMTPWGSRCTQVCSTFVVLLRDALLLFSLCPFGCDTWAQRCGFCGRLCEGRKPPVACFSVN